MTSGAKVELLEKHAGTTSGERLKGINSDLNDKVMTKGVDQETETAGHNQVVET